MGSDRRPPGVSLKRGGDGLTFWAEIVKLPGRSECLPTGEIFPYLGEAPLLAQ